MAGTRALALLGAARLPRDSSISNLSGATET